ncbi:hypothetical protein QNA08_08570 [Chelatococcus sp. SYSU_G07232]|uniref:Uncharacterized protein n=1 Tax=Chelatococcus albus TaxID=3047466 RepID=A0ABT7AFZ3_9HYPH|nr:hypothetical protein [Chelatococcus sp. SYSU_G07232]MDJ1158284.1 hypothetical protein [Chelatococcus sp. SYSU_G07232]
MARFAATLKAAFVGAAATAIVGGLTAYVTWAKQSEANELARRSLELQVAKATSERNMERSRADRLQALIRDAATHYTDTIDRLLVEVRRELERKEGPSQLAPAARAMVAARDEFRGAFDAVRVQLDGDFDRVSLELSAGPADEARLRQILEALQRSWPAKKSALELAIRKVLDDLGLKAGA